MNDEIHGMAFGCSELFPCVCFSEVDKGVIQ